MKKILMCVVVAVIFSLAYAAIPFSVEAVSEDKPEEKSFLETAKEMYDEAELRNEIRKEQERKQKEQKGEEGGWIYKNICQPVLATIVAIIAVVVFAYTVYAVLGPWVIALMILTGIIELCKWLF